MLQLIDLYKLDLSLSFTKSTRIKIERTFDQYCESSNDETKTSTYGKKTTKRKNEWKMRSINTLNSYKTTPLF